MPDIDAVEAALRALRHRDLSVADLERRLAGGGYGDVERAEAVATLERTGVVDDRRYAGSRARVLAERGGGDALIRHELEGAGLAPELVEDALALLEPEGDRARLIVDRRGAGPRTARYLASKGFSEDAVGLALAPIARGSGSALG